MLTLVDILKALLEVAGLALLGQGLLFLFAGSKRESNVIYQALATVTRPVIRITRFITPRIASTVTSASWPSCWWCSGGSWCWSKSSRSARRAR